MVVFLVFCVSQKNHLCMTELCLRKHCFYCHIFRNCISEHFRKYAFIRFTSQCLLYQWCVKSFHLNILGKFVYEQTLIQVNFFSSPYHYKLNEPHQLRYSMVNEKQKQIMRIWNWFSLVKLELLRSAVFYFLKQVNQVSRTIDSDVIFLA